MKAWGVSLTTFAAVVALGCADDAIVTSVTPPDGQEVTPFRIHARLDGRTSYILVWRLEEPVEAHVTVNGLTIPQLSSSSEPAYFADRAILPGPVVLEVTVDGHTALAVGDMPETPLFTAPAGGTVFWSSDSIALAWSSVADPDFFEILGEDSGFCCGPVVVADGAARALKIAAGDLGFLGHGRLIIRAVKTGSFVGPAAQDSQILLSSTSDVAITINPVLEEVAPFRVHAFLGGQNQVVFAERDGEGIGPDPVEAQLVTVNGLSIPRTAGQNVHRGRLDIPRGPVVLEVIVAGHTARAVGDMPETPILTAPASGTVLGSTDSITIAWSSDTNPEFFEIYGNAGIGWDCCFASIVADGTARAVKIAASDLGFLGNGRLILRAVNRGGSFTEPADPESPWRLSSVESEVAITITP